MKSCPTCQRTFPDNSPDSCPYDGARLVGDAAPQQQYNASGQQAPPYGAPGNQPPAPQWPPPPPAQNYGGNQPPGQYASPYGSPYAAAGGSKILSTLAFVCGLIALLITGVTIVVGVLRENNSLDSSTLDTFTTILNPLYLYVLPTIAGAGLILGIASLVMVRKNPAISKAKAIIGLCLSIICILFFILVLRRLYT